MKLVHRDLKPSNVLLAEDGPRVIDFGISRAAEATSMTRAGTWLGSPGFMSPEQAEADDDMVGPPSDIFSLGAVLAFAATGESPFGSGLTAALVYRIVHAPARLDRVPDLLRPLVERCLAKDPSQRPSAEELLTEVGAVHPMTGWLPDRMTRAFPDGPAQEATDPSPPPLLTPDAEAVLSDAALPDAALPDTALPEAPAPEAAAPGAETAPETEAVPSGAQAGELAVTPFDISATITGDTPLIAPRPQAVTPQAGAVTPEAGAVTSGGEAVTPEPATGPPEFKTTAPEPEPEPGTGPEAPVVPLPWGDLQDKRRSGVRRPLVLGVAAAILLIASGATAFALSGSGHASASPPATLSASAPTAAPVTTTSVQSATTQPSPTATRTTHRPAASPSGRPNAQPTTATTTAQAPTTAPAPAPSTSSSKPRPTHTAAPTYSFSVSGAGQYSCGDESSVHSSAGASVQFGFVNDTSGNLQLDEISASGALVYAATVAPGGSYGVGTNVGVYWVVESSGGGCLAVFGINGAGQVTVR